MKREFGPRRLFRFVQLDGGERGLRRRMEAPRAVTVPGVGKGRHHTWLWLTEGDGKSQKWGHEKAAFVGIQGPQEQPARGAIGRKAVGKDQDTTHSTHWNYRVEFYISSVFPEGFLPPQIHLQSCTDSVGCASRIQQIHIE